MLDATAIKYTKSLRLNNLNTQSAIEAAVTAAFKAGYEYRKRLSYVEAYTPSEDVLPKTINPLRTTVDSWRKR